MGLRACSTSSSCAIDKKVAASRGSDGWAEWTQRYPDVGGLCVSWSINAGLIRAVSRALTR